MFSNKSRFFLTFLDTPWQIYFKLRTRSQQKNKKNTEQNSCYKKLCNFVFFSVPSIVVEMKNKKEDEEVVKEIKNSKPKEIHEQMKNVYKKQFEQLRSSNSSHGKRS